jgi:hypothetical protein
VRGKSPRWQKHTMRTVPVPEATAKDISHEKISLFHHLYHHCLNTFAHYYSPSVKLPPLPKWPEANQLPCRTLLRKTMVPRAIALGPRPLPTALVTRLDPTSVTPMPQRSTAAALAPTLHSLSSVGSPSSHMKDHGTAWSSPEGQANRPANTIEFNPL